MPLFNSDDYNNLHPELERIPAGMTDNSYTVAMIREYVAWLTSLVERWPESSSEVDRAFWFARLSNRVHRRHAEDDPNLTILLVAAGSLAHLLEALQFETRSDALKHLNESLENRLRRSADAPSQILVKSFREAVRALVVDDSEDGILLFLMRIMDLAHDDNGTIKVEIAVQAAWLATIGVVAILTGSESSIVRLQLLAVLESHAEALAGEPILPYFEGANE